jgi:hypothetical protein
MSHYHETITLASLRAARHWLAVSARRAWVAPDLRQLP